MGAAVAQWIRLRLPSCRPGFESQAHHLSFYQFIFELYHVEKDENKQKEAGIGPLKKTIERGGASLFQYSFLNGPTLASFSFIFGLFIQTSLQFLEQLCVKNVHPVYGASIRTHNLWNMSLIP